MLIKLTPLAAEAGARLCPKCNDPDASSYCPDCGSLKDKVAPVCPHCSTFWVPCWNCGGRAVGDGRRADSYRRGEPAREEVERGGGTASRAQKVSEK